MVDPFPLVRHSISTPLNILFTVEKNKKQNTGNSDQTCVPIKYIVYSKKKSNTYGQYVIFTGLLKNQWQSLL